GYNLPSTFDDILDNDAKEMICTGYFHSLGKQLVESVRGNKFPLPDKANLLAAFTDTGGQYVEEDNLLGGGSYSFPQAYKVFMKNLAKEVNIKGKFLFHPIRLALTGEMSGQDVTKQLSLLTMATTNSSLNKNALCGFIVPLDDRIMRLEEFLDTIPDEFRSPAVEGRNVLDLGQEINKKTAVSSESSKVWESAGNGADARQSYGGPPITALDIRVGLITRVWEHEEADKLFCEEIDVGEAEPRTIASGLRPFFKKEDLENRKVLVLCNLKARKMVGFPSHGMVLCASNDDHTDVRFVCPPSDAQIGERVTIPGWDFEAEEGRPYAENKLSKKKVFESLAPYLKTSEFGVPEFLGSPFMTS
ncbi:MAG: hypothetical protein ACRDL7_13455, partial [Gaiellaceae bacterium]